MRALALGLLCCASTAVAAGREAAPKLDVLVQAEVKIEAARVARDLEERYAFADQAAALCERAVAERPKDTEPLLHLLRALTIGDPAHPERCRPGRCEKALEVLARLRKVDVLGLEAVATAAEEGLVLARLQRFAEAVAAYDRALPLVDAMRRPNRIDERAETATLWGNSAETAMALGRLDDAIRRYEIAIDHAGHGEQGWQLALYGLGVALDRDGQVDRARKAIERVLEVDPSMSRLHDESVFFSPPGDLHYYEGLAYEVAGDAAHARAAFAQFLVAQPGSRYAGRARAHVAALGATPPAQSVDEGPRLTIGEPRAVRGGRGAGTIRVRLEVYRGAILTCYERFLREHPQQAVEVQLAIEIAPQGFVANRARVLPGSESDSSLARCIELAADSWRFAALSASGDADLVVVPLALAPAPAPAPRRARVR